MMQRKSLELFSEGPEMTFNLGMKLAGLLEVGDVVALYGELGSGKTLLSQGICKGLDVDEFVTSPSFVLIREYHGRLPVFHIDFYRLESDMEICDLDIDRYIYDDGVCIIEWAERGESLLPEGRISIHLFHVIDGRMESEERRRIVIDAPSSRGIEVIKL